MAYDDEKASGSEREIWSFSWTLRDYMIKPSKWLLTVCTLGTAPFFVFLSRWYVKWILTNERLVVKRGILSRSIDEIELFRIKDSKVHQTFLERLVSIGTITVISNDETGDIVMTPITDPFGKRGEIRRLANAARDKRGVRTIETN